jgi:hypothetical protein
VDRGGADGGRFTFPPNYLEWLVIVVQCFNICVCYHSGSQE